MGTDQQLGCSSIHKLGLEATGCFSHLTAYLSCCVDSCFKVHGTALNWIFCFTISFSSGGQWWRWRVVRARVAAAVVEGVITGQGRGLQLAEQEPSVLWSR